MSHIVHHTNQSSWQNSARALNYAPPSRTIAGQRHPLRRYHWQNPDKRYRRTRSIFFQRSSRRFASIAPCWDRTRWDCVHTRAVKPHCPPSPPLNLRAYRRDPTRWFCENNTGSVSPPTRRWQKLECGCPTWDPVTIFRYREGGTGQRILPRCDRLQCHSAFAPRRCSPYPENRRTRISERVSRILDRRQSVRIPSWRRFLIDSLRRHGHLAIPRAGRFHRGRLPRTR
mmetsp:Transcript_38014/g.45919  ORF Transcript_38014/g.45919 Transcript_38014/m.45919 type:complete len:228 (+) Transcript_38014:754-1437(+)